jgi:hypothetical protein
VQDALENGINHHLTGNTKARYLQLNGEDSDDANFVETSID